LFRVILLPDEESRYVHVVQRTLDGFPCDFRQCAISLPVSRTLVIKASKVVQQRLCGTVCRTLTQTSPEAHLCGLPLTHQVVVQPLIIHVSHSRIESGCTTAPKLVSLRWCLGADKVRVDNIVINSVHRRKVEAGTSERILTIAYCTRRQVWHTCKPSEVQTRSRREPAQLHAMQPVLGAIQSTCTGTA
jgi:hypothetical protein